MQDKEYWITSSRFKFIALILLIMFLVFMALLYLKTDELTKHPCQICSQKMGQDVICSIGYEQRTFLPNLTIIDEDFRE